MRDGLNDPFGGLLGYQLRRASMLMASDLGDRLEPLQLTVTGLSVLLMIEANPGVRQTELAKVLGIKSANLAPLVAGFAARGLIDRRPTDKRSHGLRLTPEGLDLASRAWREVGASEARFSRCVSAEERRMLNGLLAALRDVAHAEPALSGGALASTTVCP
jgi:DNA-binding MarR family transcriptional regulator